MIIENKKRENEVGYNLMTYNYTQNNNTNKTNNKINNYSEEEGNIIILQIFL